MKILLSGGNPLGEDLIADMFKKWQFFFDLFFMIVDRRHGNLLHLPFDTDACNQPYKTMQVISLMRDLFVSHIAEEERRSMNR